MTKVETRINDLSCFKATCKKHNVDYVENQDKNFHMKGFPVVATLQDLAPVGGYMKTAYVVEQEGVLALCWDNDQNYASLSNRLGKDGGILMRDYASGIIQRGVSMSGGMINSQEVLQDGSLVLKVAVGGM